MNILQVHNKYLFKGGEDQVVEQEKKMLLDNGHNVFQIIRSNKEEIVTIQDKFYSLLNLSYSKKTKEIINDNLKKLPKIDIAHVHNIFPLWTYSILESLYENKIPIVMTLHNFRLIWHKLNIFENEIKRYAIFKNSRIKTFIISRLINKKKNLLNLVSKFIVLSDFSKKKFINNGFPKNKIILKNNFLDRSNFKQKKIENKKFIIFVSRIEKLKGINFLLNNWQNFNETLKIYGDGPLFSKLKRNNSNKYILFKGQRSPKIIDEELNKAKFLIFPTQYYENMPMIILQAFRAGTLVLASNIGSIKNFIKDGYNGILFNPEDPNDFKKKIEWIYLNNKKCNKIVLNAYNDFLKYYTEKSNYKKLLKIYNKVILKN